LVEHIDNLEEPTGVGLPESDARPFPRCEVITRPGHHLLDLLLGDPMLMDMGLAGLWVDVEAQLHERDSSGPNPKPDRAGCLLGLPASGTSIGTLPARRRLLVSELRSSSTALSAAPLLLLPRPLPS
jgi:hypothetical protein